MSKSPDHYTYSSIESWDYMKATMTKDEFQGYLEGNVKKYLHRYKYKGDPLGDLLKAQVYLDKLIKEKENER